MNKYSKVLRVRPVSVHDCNAAADEIDRLEAQNARLMSRGIQDLHFENDELRAEVVRLEQLIANAPHAENCAWHHDTIGCAPKLYEISECDCWKSRAITPCDHKDWEPVWPRTMAEYDGKNHWRCRTCGVKGTYTVEPA